MTHTIDVYQETDGFLLVASGDYSDIVSRLSQYQYSKYFKDIAKVRAYAKKLAKRVRRDYKNKVAVHYIEHVI
jgi:hypothetical protein